MTTRKTLGYLALAGLIALGCLCSALFGAMAGGVAGGAAGFAVGRRSAGLAVPRVPQVQPLTRTPLPQITTPLPRPQVTPQPQRTPQPQVTPQTPRAPFPSDQTGALVQSVDPDSAAEKAGLKAGDLITAVDKVPVDANHALAGLIQAHKPGDKVTLTVLRNARTLNLDATLGTRKLETGQEVAALGITYVAYSPTGPTD